MVYLTKLAALSSLTVIASALTGCLGDRPIEVNCDEVCSAGGDGDLRVYEMIHNKLPELTLDKKGKPVTSSDEPSGNSHSGLFVLDPEGNKLISPGDAKREALNPYCFSKVSYKSPHLKKLPLSWDDITITLINFDKHGRLESRELGDIDKAGAVKLEIQGALNDSIYPDHQQVAKILSKLDVNGFPNIGRPQAGQQTNKGYKPRDLDFVPAGKTPFYKGFNSDPIRGHVFFYVLIDDHVKFIRDHAAVIPSTPSIGQLYSPFTQYPIYPPLGTGDPERVDVLTFQYYRGGDMADPKNIGEKDRCIYPYDIGVVAKGQAGFSHVQTPLLIDPEVDTRGPTL